MVASLAGITGMAVIPDQLIPYVSAVSGLESSVIGSCLLHRGGSEAVLVAYPSHNPLDMEAANEAVAEALKIDGIEHISVLAPERPALAPQDANVTTDSYWQIPLPYSKHGQKLRNMLKRAARDLTITQESGSRAWSAEHGALAAEFCQHKKNLDAGARYLFGKLGDYVASAPDAIVFSARHKISNSLEALAIGDYTALETCFYMFACRKPEATPGAADLLLQNLAAEGAARGHARLNLGLGIDSGIEFFKKKWNAEKYPPLVETSWNIKRKSKIFSWIFGK